MERLPEGRRRERERERVRESKQKERRRVLPRRELVWVQKPQKLRKRRCVEFLNYN